VANFDIAFPTFILSLSSISSKIEDRIYPERLPPKVALPAITWLLIPGGSVTRGHGEKAGLLTAVIQLECWAVSRAKASELEYIVFNAIDGYRGPWGTSPNQISVQHCLARSMPYDLPEPETNRYRRIRDYSIMWKEN